MPDHSCSSLMRSAIYPTPTVTLTCCSNCLASLSE
jgi:hypothetical protein